MKPNDLRDLFAQANRKSRAIPCEIIRTVEYEYDSGEAFYTMTIEIVRGNKHTKNCIGIHRFAFKADSDAQVELMLDDAIETAMRDGFERIYIYRGDV